MWDSLVRATALDNTLRVSAVTTTKLVEEARKRHNTFPVASAALGRTMTGTLLLSWGLKEEGSITVRVLGDGPLGGIVATANAQGEIKGYVQEPHVDLPLNDKGKLDVGGAVGKGHLYVTKDLGIERPYTGSVELETGEIGDDLARYFLESEQTNSLVIVGVLVGTDNSILGAGGIIVQVLPGADEKVLIDIEKHLETISPISTLVSEGMDAKGLIEEYLKDIDYKILEEKPVLFKCGCSKEKLEKILISLGKEELEDIIKKEGKAEIRCHFCNEEHVFSKEELENILVQIDENNKK